MQGAVKWHVLHVSADINKIFALNRTSMLELSLGTFNICAKTSGCLFLC